MYTTGSAVVTRTRVVMVLAAIAALIAAASIVVFVAASNERGTAPGASARRADVEQLHDEIGARDAAWVNSRR